MNINIIIILYSNVNIQMLLYINALRSTVMVLKEKAKVRRADFFSVVVVVPKPQLC